VGRFGNWFNNELHGGPTTLPWGLEVHRMDPDNPGRALTGPDGTAELLPGLYHPAFLYEAVWDVAVALAVFALDRRYRFGKGRAFAVYVMGYTAGRFWIEMLRTDEANEILGARLNVWVSVLVFLGALAYFTRVRGPREYLIPLEINDAGAPVRWRVGTEDEYRRFQRTGAVASDVPEEPALATVGAGATAAGAAGGAAAVAGAGADDGTTAAAEPVPAEPVPAEAGADEDDGADLVDTSVPALDDFADDETDDETDPADAGVPGDDEDDEDEPAAGGDPGPTGRV